MGPVSGSTKPTGPAVEILAPVGVEGAAPLLDDRRDSPISAMVDQLAGEVVLRHVGGRRVLDLGHGAPRVTEWVTSRAASLDVVDAIDLGRGSSIRVPFADGGFDVVFCLRTLAHLGRDAQSSHDAATSALREVSRLLSPGGTAIVQFDNALSLWGLYNGIRKPLTAVERGPLVVEGARGLTRFDSVRRVKRLLPPRLELKTFHGLSIVATLPQALRVPVVRNVVRRFEWFARDRVGLRSLGAHVLFVLRRLDDLPASR